MPNTPSNPADVLSAAAQALGSAGSVGEAAASLLYLLQESGWIAAGAVDVHSEEPARFTTGDPALQALSPLADGATLPPVGSSLAARGVLRVQVPVQCGPPSVVWLVGPCQTARELAPALAALLASATDRVALQDQVAALHAEAQQHMKEVGTIYEIGRIVDAGETARLLDTLTEKAARLMGAQTCSLMRLDPDTNALYIASSHGLGADVVVAAQRALGEGIAGKVAATGEPLLIADGALDARLEGLALRAEAGSSMVVPMKTEKGRVTGVLSICRFRPSHDFTQDDLRLFEVFARHAALALSNKQLYDDLRRRVRELSTLSELTLAVISHLELDRLLESVADSIVDVVKVSRCCIFLYDRATRRFVPRILRGYRPDGIGRNPVKPGEGVIGLVAKKRMPIVVPDARTAMQPMRGFARSLGTDSFIAVPIMSRGQAIGVVVADNKLSGRRIRTHGIELLTTFVNQAGIAIENAQLYEEREQRYQEINRLAAQTDNILRSIAASVVVVDNLERITRWNQASEELWGVPEPDAVGRPFSWLLTEAGLDPDVAHLLHQQMETVLHSGTPYQGYQVLLRRSGRPEVCVNILLSPLIDRQGDRQGAVLVAEDVTRERALEAEMGRIRRLADIGQLAAKMAHEVRNPLSSIKGAAQLMRSDRRDLARLPEFLDIIIEEVNSLNRITTDLLMFARPMRLEPKPTQMNALVERTLRLLADHFGEPAVEVATQLAAHLPTVTADPDQIEQVLRNVVLNAVQAMPDGGSLTVATELGADGRSVVVTCEDTGVGIAPERIEDIFQPFFTTKSKGTGLGLCIVRRIVEQHGGSVAVDSRPGAGTCFRLTFPVQPPGATLAEDNLAARYALSQPLPDE